MRKKGLDFRRKRRKKINSGVLKEIGSWAFVIAVSVFLAFVIVYTFGVRTVVYGNSMEPKLYGGQQVLINRFVYVISDPDFGDVVAFLPNGNENSHYYIKRIIGTPGDTVQIRNGYLYLNGAKLNEGEEFDKIADPGIAENEITLGEDEYFVLGDNRNFSEDSRSGNVGVVKKRYMLGKVWFRISKDLQFMGFVR